MYQNNDLLENFRHILTPVKYEEVTELINNITEITDPSELYLSIENLTEHADTDLDYTDIRILLEQLIIDFCKEHILAKEAGIFTNYPTFHTVAGILKFSVRIERYDPILTPEFFNILNNVDLDDYLKLGMLLSTVDNEYNPLDIYDDVDSILTGIMDVYLIIVEDLISSEEATVEGSYDIITKLVDINTDLITTALFKYYIDNDPDAVTEDIALNYIDYKVGSSDITDESLAKELLVFAIVYDKTNEDMLDIITSLYDNYNTTYITEYIGVNLKE